MNVSQKLSVIAWNYAFLEIIMFLFVNYLNWRIHNIDTISHFEVIAVMMQFLHCILLTHIGLKKLHYGDDTYESVSKNHNIFIQISLKFFS